MSTKKPKATPKEFKQEQKLHLLHIKIGIRDIAEIGRAEIEDKSDAFFDKIIREMKELTIGLLGGECVRVRRAYENIRRISDGGMKRYPRRLETLSRFETINILCNVAMQIIENPGSYEDAA